MKFLELLYNKVFVNIIIKKESIFVNIDISSKKTILYSYEDEFESLNENMVKFINLYIEESPYYYISLLDTSTIQGAIPTCMRNRISQYHDISDCEYKCYDNRWSYYTSKTDIYELEKSYNQIGLDFIFSPFTILANFFKDKIDSTIALYVLIQEESISISIFDNRELLYAKYSEIYEEQENEEFDTSEDTEELELDDGIDLEDVNVIDDIDSLDDFGDIEDLESLDDIDEFSQTADIEEEFNQEQEEEVEENSVSGFNQDYQRFIVIQKAIKYFYKDSRYKSEFVENVYIADSVGVSIDLKRYFEEEMFMNVYIRHISLSSELFELANKEVYV